jgi:hypothetical protein
MIPDLVAVLLHDIILTMQKAHARVLSMEDARDWFRLRHLRSVRLRAASDMALMSSCTFAMPKGKE